MNTLDPIIEKSQKSPLVHRQRRMRLGKTALLGCFDRSRPKTRGVPCVSLEGGGDSSRASSASKHLRFCAERTCVATGLRKGLVRLDGHSWAIQTQNCRCSPRASIATTLEMIGERRAAHRAGRAGEHPGLAWCSGGGLYVRPRACLNHASRNTLPRFRAHSAKIGFVGHGWN